MDPKYCKNPPCGACPDWPATCPTCHYAKEITPERYEKEMALLAAEAESLGADAITISLTRDERGQPVLIVDIPHTKECAACGMDDSMESDLTLCPICHCCLHWEDEFGAGKCCACPKTEEA